MLNIKLPAWLHILKRTSHNTKMHKIVEAIQEAELNTSGEIRVVVDTNGNTKISVLERAQKTFLKEKMHYTKQRNAVLFYIDLKNKQIAIWGDEGIHQKLGSTYWHSIIEAILEKIKSPKDWIVGLNNGIIEMGKALKTYYPYHQGDINELNDDVIIK